MGVRIAKTGLHLGGSMINYLFFDGHVKAYRPSDINADPKGNWGFLPGVGDG
jgi:prepilin-type processing-associated H-X9-DG protein